MSAPTRPASYQRFKEPSSPIPLDRSKFRENGSQPPPNRTGYLSHHPALRFPCVFDCGRLPRLWIMFRIVSAVRISRTLTSCPWETCLHFALGLLGLLCARVDGFPVR
jgi:hypothetical protein